MVLLWKDPEGKTVTTIKKAGALPPKSDSSVKEIKTLEKTIIEKDLVIVQLRDEITTLKGVQVRSITIKKIHDA